MTCHRDLDDGVELFGAQQQDSGSVHSLALDPLHGGALELRPEGILQGPGGHATHLHQIIQGEPLMQLQHDLGTKLLQTF